MKLLYVIAHPNQDNSTSVKISNKFVNTFIKSHPSCEVEVLDLYKNPPEHLSLDYLTGKNETQVKTAKHFSEFDYYVFAAPMWNFFIPSILKAYIDNVVIPGVTFNYREGEYPLGLLNNKKAMCIFAKGAFYDEEPMASTEFDRKYMKHVLGFMGITDVSFVEAEGLGVVPQEEKIKLINNAIKEAELSALSF